jgi:hypothetical protein
MERKIKTAVIALFLTGSLIIPTASWARDYWHWENNRWDRRADLRTDHRDLEEAKRQLQYDLSHHASRKKLAEDNARIQDIERDIRVDRRAQR